MPALIGTRSRSADAGLADAGMREDAVAAVKPAVRAPAEAVKRLVGIVQPPAVEQDLRRAVGSVVAVAVGNEQQMRRCADPAPPNPTSRPLTRFK